MNYGQQDPTWEKYHRNSSINRYSRWGKKNPNSFKKINLLNKGDRTYNVYSAGILPYTYDTKGNLFFLLGKDQDGYWSDFGGRVEDEDQEDHAKTASREFFEETLGSISSINETYLKLVQGNPLKIESKTLNGSPYYMFMLYIDFKDWNDMFIRTFNFLKYTDAPTKFFEKTQIRWATLPTLIQTLESKNSNDSNNFIALRKVFYDTLLSSKDEIISLDSTSI
jgi:8-oxo-dGTP pyrophosphatase MutT (NUDIX family)